MAIGGLDTGGVGNSLNKVTARHMVLSHDHSTCSTHQISGRAACLHSHVANNIDK